LQPRTLALLVLLFGGLSLFLLGIVAAPLLGLIPPRSISGYPAATISLDLADQVVTLQEERAQLSAALSRSLRDIEGLEDRLAGAPVSEVPPEARDARAEQAAEAQAAFADVELRAEAAALEIRMLRAQRDALQADLTALAEETDRLRAALAGRDDEIAALTRRAEQTEATPPATRAAATATPGADSGAPVAQTPAAGDEQPAGPVPTPDAPGSAEPKDEVSPSGAQDLAVADGVAAYRAGDYATAFALWEPLAEAGDARAQFHLGALYYEGRGVARNTATARPS
jgi:hypothetical protein